jgi:hypothetical protein
MKRKISESKLPPTGMPQQIMPNQKISSASTLSTNVSFKNTRIK